MTPSACHSFSEYHKTITDWELLSILENSEEYQEIAIESARQELERRQLLPAEIEAIKKDLAQTKLQKEQKEQKLKKAERTIRERFRNVLASLNPILEELPTAEKIVRFIVVFWGLLTLYQMVHDYRIEFRAGKAFPFHPFVNSVLLFPYIMLPISIYQLWNRRPSGWTLFIIYLSFQLLGEVWMFYHALTWEPTGVEWMDRLIKPSVPGNFLRLLFVAGTFYAMCRLNVRAMFLINRKKMVTIIGSSVAGALLVFLALANQ